jgi:UPF0716 protein FxsA
MRFILPLFIIVPIIEMLVLIEVGGLIGAIPTIALVLLTAVIGLQLLRQQGLSTLLKANEKMAQGGLPAEEMAEGILLAVGGALLLTPGFVTDFIGFSLLIPTSRKALLRHLLKKGLLNMQANMSQGGFYYQSGTGQKPFAEDDIIEGEYQAEIKEQIEKKS